MRQIAIIIAAVAGLLNAGVVRAQDEPFDIPRDWTVTLGIEGLVLPAFAGSDRYILAAAPIVDIRRAGTPRQFSSPRDGISFAIINIGQFRLGPTGKVILPRDQNDDPALAGLGDVDWAVEVGVFAEYWVRPWLRTRAEARQGFGGHDGVVADLSADVVVPATETLTLSAGPRLTLATADALQPYFGVTPAQSLASGLPVFTPSGGLRAYGFGGQVRQQWSPQWATNLYLEYDRLAGDVANSPVLSRNGSVNQVTVGLGVSYTFDISLR